MTSDMHDLVAPYALDALDETERAAFEAHLASCGDCRNELIELRSGAAVLGSADWAPPPARMRRAVLDGIADVAQDEVVANVTPLRRPTWTRRVALSVVSAAAVIAILTLSVQVARLNARLDTSVESILAAADGRVVSLEGTAGVTARFVFSPAEDRGVFIAEGLAALPSDQEYQLWMIGDGGPISAGLFRPGTDTVTLEVVGDVGGAVAVGLTAEPAGGSPAPTGDILLLGALSG